MKLCIVVPTLPPVLDGIGDYTALLSAELTRSADVTVLVASGTAYDPIAGVRVIPAFAPGRRSDVWRIESRIRELRPDWMLLQYNPFGYGRRGLNLSLPRVVRAVRRYCRVAVMFHETYMWAKNLRWAIMGSWQRLQFRQIGRSADELLFSISPWIRQHAGMFPEKPMTHLPVGSNVPRVEISREEARPALKIADDEVVLTLFGQARWDRPFHYLGRAAEAVQRSGRRPLILYLGPDGERIRSAFGAFRHITDGPLPAPEISRRLAATDVYLAPYDRGISTRRGGLMAGLQHGLPIAATRGWDTEPVLADADRQAYLLADEDDDGAAFVRNVMRLVDDPALRQRLAEGGRALYEANFTWRVIASKLMSRLAVPAGAQS